MPGSPLSSMMALWMLNERMAPPMPCGETRPLLGLRSPGRV